MWKKIIGSLLLVLAVVLIIILLKKEPIGDIFITVLLVSGINMCIVWGTLLITGIHI
jgi:hypothetical protein